MRRLDWTVDARDDLAAIDAYWWAYAPDRADQVLDQIEAAAEFLLGMPHAGPALDRDRARKWSVRSTRYLLLYRIREDSIEILRVHHMSEDRPELA